MAADRAPAFQCYPRDLLADGNVRAMDLAEFGAYWILVCISWTEGSIPADLKQLARLLPRTTEKQMSALWPAIAPCFEPHPTQPGRLVQPRLERVREEQAKYRARRAEAGKRGADARWQSGGGGMAIASESHSGRTANAIANDSSASAPAIVPSLTTFETAPAASQPKPRKARKVRPVDDSWKAPLRDEIVAIQHRSLHDLTGSELIAVARHHAVVFANCTTSLAKNLSASRKIASSLRWMVKDLARDSLDLTVREYFAIGKKYFEKTGETPWYRPQELLAVLKPEAA